MTRRPMIAGNWKMNKTPAETRAFIEALLPQVDAELACDLLVIPPYTSLDLAGRLLADTGVRLGAQDLHTSPSGAFTGAISAGMLDACGCAYVLVGHSERRHVFGDSDATVNAKLRAAIAGGLTPIFCVGERSEQRAAEQTTAVLAHQLTEGFAEVAATEASDVLIAYEPVWAIGTGETASPDQAQDAIRFIRNWVADQYTASLAEGMRILYGGSVKPNNAAELQRQPDIDGALVGGASLEPESFLQIVQAAGRGAS